MTALEKQLNVRPVDPRNSHDRTKTIEPNRTY